MRILLQFIFGLPHSGKTSLILEKIKELSNNNKKSIIIVPEQASFETEKKVLKTLGDNFMLNVQVLSFSRLYNEVYRNLGGLSAKVLSDTEKTIFMSKAIKQVANDLKIWGKYSRSLNFSKTMLDTIGEFKINGIEPQEIKNAIDLTTSENLKLKLYDLTLIYETYNLLIAERYLDPADSLTKLYYTLEGYNFFADKTVFIDGFKGFTGQQYKIIDRILTQAQDIYIALTNDINSNKEYDVFANIRSSALKIKKIAQSHNVKTLEPQFLDKGYYISSELSKLERLLCNSETPKIEDNSITICAAKTIFDEAEFAARTIRKLVRTGNYRFGDFAIIARDSEKYSQAIEYACDKNNVNCFFDKKIPLIAFPLSIAALSAIKALDFSTENILKFHKSGIDVLSTDEISRLENYTYLWNINGKIWFENWDMDVRGFVTDEATEQDKLDLAQINELRIKAITPILNLKNNFGENAKSMCSAIFNLFLECDFKTALDNLCKNLQDNTYKADALKQSYDLTIKIFESLVNCYDNQNLSVSEFYEALSLALSKEEVGLIPQTLDQVIFGQADRIRPTNAKITFILGANQGVFPKHSGNNSIFAIRERKNLIELGLNIADNEIYSAIDENFLVYCNLTSSLEGLYISYATQTLKGESLSPSSFVLSILEVLNPALIMEPCDDLTLENLPETRNAAYSEYCRRFNNITEDTLLRDALEIKAERLSNVVNNKVNSIKKENANKLYGRDIYMSATKFDTFNRCKFSFFCKYGLRLKKLQPADFDVLQRGTIVHYVLERIIDTYKEEIKDFSKEKCDYLCDHYIEEYLNSVVGYNSVKNARHDFLISKISRSLKEVVFHISQEFAQSKFVPTHCELKIGGKDGLPLSFDYSEGKVILNGSIDRVDEYNGYIRIVDYKTGTKSFKLPDVLFGLNLQMLIYLYAVIRGQKLSDQNAAGIFYMPSKRDLNNEGMAMNGLIQADIELLKAMEEENKGEYVPALSLNKDGSIAKTATSFISHEEFGLIFDHIEKLMQKTGDSIAKGEINIDPVDGRESTACVYCDFKSVCNFESDFAFKVPNLKNSEVFQQIAKEDNDGL